MRELRFTAIVLLVIGISLSADDKKKQQQAYYLKPDQTADLAGVKMTTAKQDCENWAVAAGLETMLREQNVTLDQNFWVMRLSGGEPCLSELPSIESLSHMVNNEFVLDDGRHVRLQLHFISGAPRDLDPVIAALKQQQASLLLWRGHPWYLTGVTYDEHIGRDGTRMFEIKELRLADTYAGKPGIAFAKGRDDAAEIQGILTVSASEL